MQPFDVDTNDELLAARRSDEDVWWHQAEKNQQARHRHKSWLIAAAVLALLALTVALAALAAAAVSAARISRLNTRNDGSDISSNSGSSQPEWSQIKKIAFSSCTSYDVRPQPIWTKGVIPSQPDAWVWLGDFAYFDDPLVNCELVPSFPECNCTADFMRRPPFQCFAGVAEHARLRVQLQLGIREYQRFLSYMCPGYEKTGAFPPAGSDPRMCPKPIFGTYDDHDSGANNGNARNPSKDTIKNIYLDGLGEPRDSPRRSTTNGLQVRVSKRARKLPRSSASCIMVHRPL